MENILKFTGTFKNLKKLGCTFHKLYAMNYKVYCKDLGGGTKFWIWVHHGGYIELNDYYSNTKNFIKALKSINWDEVEEEESMFPEFRKTRFIHFNHSEPNKGFKVSDKSLETETMILAHENGFDFPNFNNNDEYQKIYKEARKEFDRDKIVTPASAKEILEVYEQLQNS